VTWKPGRKSKVRRQKGGGEDAVRSLSIKREGKTQCGIVGGRGPEEVIMGRNTGSLRRVEIRIWRFENKKGRGGDQTIRQ